MLSLLNHSTTPKSGRGLIAKGAWPNILRMLRAQSIKTVEESYASGDRTLLDPHPTGGHPGLIASTVLVVITVLVVTIAIKNLICDFSMSCLATNNKV